VNNRLGFWDTVTGDEIRNIEVTKKGRLTCLDLSLDGKYIAVGADDSSVRVLHYDQASTFRIGNARCGRINSVQFGPDSLSLVAATEFGAVILWRFDRE